MIFCYGLFLFLQKICFGMRMDDLIQAFPAQLKRAIEIGENARIGKSKFRYVIYLSPGLGIRYWRNYIV